MNVSTFFNNVSQKGYIFKTLGRAGLLNWMGDDVYLRKLYFYEMGYYPDLKNPKTFNEKLQWLKIHDQKDVYHVLSDKYLAKDYVANIIGSSHVIPTLATWESADEINIENLPNAFVLKCNHDQGSVIVCRDKATFDLSTAKEKLKKNLITKSYFGTRENQYAGIIPLIMAEPFLSDKHAQSVESGLTDFKFYCFNGKPEFLYIGRGYTFDHSLKMDFYNLDLELMPFYRTDYGRLGNNIERPNSFDEMISIAEKLSKDTFFVRVDLYDVDGIAYFSEFTLFPGAGFQHFVPENTDRELGLKLVLPIEEKNGG